MCFNFCCLHSRSPALHSGNSLHLPSMRSVFVILTFNSAHLKFTVYGPSKQANIHTHVRSAVPLVWGSLRLAPITVFLFIYLFEAFIWVCDLLMLQMFGAVPSPPHFCYYKLCTLTKKIETEEKMAEWGKDFFIPYCNPALSFSVLV